MQFDVSDKRGRRGRLFARRRERGPQFAVFGRVVRDVVSGRENDRSTVSIYASEKGAFCNRRAGRRVAVFYRPLRRASVDVAPILLKENECD